ncbi:hypothetical protein CC78DRAFT_450102, partial [Lojkania enalia]
ILATVASVASLVDMLGRVITTIGGIIAQWKDPDISILNTNTQLIILKAAVVEIKDWMETYPGEIHHQLVMDLDDSLGCCQRLATRLDKDVAQLNKSLSRPVPTSVRARFVLRSKPMAELQRMIDTQISALTLLLTACNSKTLAAQRRLLEKSTSRKTLDALKKDSVSLKALRDTESIFTDTTDRLSKLSKVFDFDAQLFASKAY